MTNAKCVNVTSVWGVWGGVGVCEWGWGCGDVGVIDMYVYTCSDSLSTDSVLVEGYMSFL